MTASINDRRLTAADYMSEDLDREIEYMEMEDMEDEDVDVEEEIDMKEHFRALEAKRLRLFIKGEYELEEGEILVAFDAISDDSQLVCDLAIAYIKSLDGFKKCCNLNDVTDFTLDTTDDLKLNSAEALKIYSTILGEAICNLL